MEILYTNKFVEFSRLQAGVMQVKYLSQSPTDHDFDEYLSYLDKIYALGENFFMILDLRLAGSYMATAHRVKLGNWLKINQEKMKKHNKGAAFVSGSIVHQLIMKAVFAIQHYPVEYTIVRTDLEVDRWLASKGIIR
ncbi:hypothetical protein SAMN05421780_101421 [Flexibacter flexilis DSM 6793]|uniref:SpoIIAA-like n=1 Tax=Flexibacter flexilis DSM 6793 TaxID=927664 RepID=A0A1I1DRP6_9BACT|nr:hypothetical protein [Flexibacter flexilis]SFB77514.1 hypothetical protein SAMN05421780_101421 [Flexibacter flexilis DSM 6793]